MTPPIILASKSEIRAILLRNAGVPFIVDAARIDEEAIRRSLLAEQATPRDIVDAIAEMKARRISSRHPEALVIGCDQVLAFGGTLLSKPKDKDDAVAQLKLVRGKTHQLFSAAVVYAQSGPQWRHVGVVRLQMRDVSDAYIVGYVDRNWDSIRHAVGGYKLEEEGVRLFTRIEGDYFNVLGLPLLELLSYLTLRGILDS